MGTAKTDDEKAAEAAAKAAAKAAAAADGDKPADGKPAATEGSGGEVKAAKPDEVFPVINAKRSIVALTEDRRQLKEHRNPGEWICVPASVTIEDLQEPAFWANVARFVKPSTTVEVHWDDASQFAELYVLSAGRNWASIAVLRHQKLAKRDLPQSGSRYQVSFNGPVDKYRITREPDNAVIKAGFASEIEARRFLDEYLRKMAA